MDKSYKMKMNKTVIVIVSIIFLLISSLIGFVWLQRNHYVGSMSRYQTIDIDNYRLKTTRTEYGYDKLYSDKYLSLFKESITKPVDNFTIEEAIKIREYMLNLGTTKGNNITGDPIELFEGLSSGKALTCGKLSLMYGFLLDSLGFTVRELGVSRSLFDAWDSHVFVEIYDEVRQKWILTDPTFNISFKKNDHFLSSDELYDNIHSGNYSSIEIVHGNKTKYEYSYEQYYISYFSLFDNLYYTSHIHLPDIYKYPPLRWFDNRRITRLVETDMHPIRGNEMHIQNTLLFIMYVLNPLTIVLLFVIGLFKYFQIWKKDRI